MRLDALTTCNACDAAPMVLGDARGYCAGCIAESETCPTCGGLDEHTDECTQDNHGLNLACGPRCAQCLTLSEIRSAAQWTACAPSPDMLPEMLSARAYDWITAHLSEYRQMVADARR